MAVSWTRKLRRLGRSAAMVAILVVGLLLIRLHYGRLHDMGMVSAPRGDADAAVPSAAAAAALDAALEPPGQRPAVPVPAAPSRPQAPPLPPVQSPPSPPPPSPPAPSIAELVAAVDATGEAAGGMQDLESESDTRALRKGLQEWLGSIATFQSIYAVYQLYVWLQHASTDKVREGLLKLVQEDSSSGWAVCAIEDEDCECPSGRVRYGHVERQWVEKKISASKQWCSLGSMANGQDMAVGMLKQCQCWQTMDTKVAVTALTNSAAASDLSGGGLWSALASPFAWAERAFGAQQVRQESAQQKLLAAEEAAAAGHSLWAQLHEVERWTSRDATLEQLSLVALLYKWLENTGQRAKIGVAVTQGAGPDVSQQHGIFCEDGKPPDLGQCPGYGQHVCRAGCSRKPPLQSARAWSASAPGVLPRSQLCAPNIVLEPLFSCDAATSRRPSKDHAHAQAQYVLDKALEVVCENKKLHDQVTVYLDCEFISQYLHWTSDASEWLEEAYVSYVGGSKNSNYEWQALNLVRSVDVFSSRPLIVVVFGDGFVPPAAWHSMPNVIVYRMHPITGHISFNFNKMRSMISSRVAVGIQLDTDQIIAPGFDRLFEGTRREINDKYPYIMMPVHWMSRDSKRPEPYWEYAFRAWGGPHSMRWGHAHPSFSYWAMPFLVDMTFERYMASMSHSPTKVFDLSDAKQRGLLSILAAGRTAQRQPANGAWIGEDEDMMNVALWRDSAYKEWCKYDLEWGLFKDGMSLDKRMYWDAYWYPNGLPVVFISMHNTKAFEITDWLLSLIARCDVVQPKLSCPPGAGPFRFCESGSTAERQLRATPTEYLSKVCCCVAHRQNGDIYWAGQWFKRKEDVPMRLKNDKKDRTCIFP